MKRDAEAHAAEDKKRREVIDLKNQGESLGLSNRKQLKEYGDKVSGEIRGNIESSLNNLRTPSRAMTATALKRRWRISSRKALSLARRFTNGPVRSGRSAPQPGPEASTDRGTAAGGEKKKDEDVIDAEYEVERVTRGRKSRRKKWPRGNAPAVFLFAGIFTWKIH